MAELPYMAPPHGRLAWAYCRVSTTKDEQELSLDEQVRWAKEYAAAEGYELTIFEERASAKTIIGRRECARMLGELETLQRNARPEVLLATSFDRLSRDLLDSATLYAALKRVNVKLFIRDRGYVPMKSFGDVAVLIGHAMGGHAENEARSVRAKASWDRRRREGKPTSNKVPYGIQLRNEWDSPAEESAIWVLRAFELYATGVGMHTIAKQFAASAPPHRTTTNRLDGSGNPIVRERRPVWDSNRVRKLFEQRRYRGLLVPEALFDRVHELIARAPKYRNTRVFEYPLSGAISCANCGRHFHGHATGAGSQRRLANGELRRYKRDSRVRYYSCTVCNYMINANLLESWFREDISRVQADPDLFKRWIAGGALAADLATVRSDASRLEQRLGSGGFETMRRRAWEIALSNGAAVAADLPHQLERIAVDERATRERLSELRRILQGDSNARRSIQRATAMLYNFWQLHDTATYERRRELTNALVTALGGAVASKDGLAWNREQPTASIVLSAAGSLKVRGVK